MRTITDKVLALELTYQKWDWVAKSKYRRRPDNWPRLKDLPMMAAGCPCCEWCEIVCEECPARYEPDCYHDTSLFWRFLQAYAYDDWEAAKQYAAEIANQSLYYLEHELRNQSGA